MKNNTLNYAKIVKTARESRNLKKKDLGEAIGVGKSTIGNYESGYSAPSIKTLEKIADVLGYPLFDLLSLGFDDPSELSLPRAAQSTSETAVAYVSEQNISERTLSMPKYMDAYITMPSFMLDDENSYLCIKMPDNSMTNDRISKNDFLIIKRASIVPDMSVVLALNTVSGDYLVRKYYRKDHIVSLLPSSDSNDYSIISYDERDNKYKIFGYVEKALINIK